MAINKDNVQVYSTLPKEIVKKIDDDAKENMRSRSKEIAYIIQQYYKQKENDWCLNTPPNQNYMII